jgi:hypothetical protein
MNAGVRQAVPPRPALLLCCVLVVVAACYLPALGAPFIWDDSHLIESPLVRELHPLRDYFSSSFWQHDDLGVARSYYRPLSVLSLALDQRVFDANPSGFHVTNLGWHLLAVGLLFALLRKQGARGDVAALGSACWGLYPRLTEAAAWISGRTDVLAGCLVLGALLAQRSASNRARWLSALLLLLGLFSKETALAGALAIAVLEFRSASSNGLRIQRLAPVSLALTVYAALRVHALGFASSALPLPLSARISAMAEAIGRYAGMVLVPWLPDVQNGRLRSRVAAFVLLGVLLGACALALSWWQRARLARLNAGYLALSLGAWGLALFAIPFSVTSIAADRFLYLPLAGVVLLAEPALSRWVSASRAALPVVSVLVLSFAAATFTRAQTWANEGELWAATLRRHPEAPSLASVTLGSAFSHQGAFKQALLLFERGSQPGMDCEELGRNNMGTTYLRSGQYQAAARLFQPLAAAHPSAGIFVVNLALAQAYLAHFTEARATLDALLAISPADGAARALRDRLPALELARQKLNALPSSAPALERARLQAAVGLSHEALLTYRAELSAPNASAAQAQEATWLALREGDAGTMADFFARYTALAADQVDGQLLLAYQSHRETLNDLERVWPTVQ